MTTKRVKMVSRMYRLTEAAFVWLKQEAARLEIPASELLRRAVDEYRARR